MQTKKILVVDNEDAVRFFIGEVLSSRGYTVRGAACGEEALAVLRAEGADLALLDYKMPGMNGLDVLRLMRAEKIDTAVIMLTAYGTLDMAVELMRGGGCDFLKKPCSNEELIATVSQALARREVEMQQARMARLMEETLNQVEKVAPADQAPAQQGEDKHRPIEIHGLLVDRQQEIVRRGVEILPLTRTEFRLLYCLVEKADSQVNYASLYETVYGKQGAAQDKSEARQALSTHIWRLRQKLGNDEHGRPYIMNVHGGYYRFISE